MSIEVTENPPKPGTCVAIANVGPSLDVYEIRVDGANAYYYIEGVEVSRDVYLDAMKTAEADRWCSCMAEDAEDETHAEHTPS